jgi:hypothetical protein
MSFRIGQVEVASIKQEEKTLSLIVYHDCRQQDVKKPVHQNIIIGHVQATIRYLITEMFIPENQEGWKVQTGILSKIK